MSAGGYVLPERAPLPGASRVLYRVFALTVATVAFIGVGVLSRVFVQSRAGQALDEATRTGASSNPAAVWKDLSGVLDLVSVPFVIGAIIFTAVVAAMRKRWLIALQVAVVIGGSNITTQVLKKSVIERPDFDYWTPGNSLPSGHTTVAFSVAAALILVLPPVARNAAALLGGLYATLSGMATIINHWHRFSDVVAAILVVLAWFAIACALSPPSTYDNPRPTGVRSTFNRAVMTLLIMVFAVTAWRAWYGFGDLWAQANANFVVDIEPAATFGYLVVVATAAVSFAVMLGLRHMLAKGYSTEDGISGPQRTRAERQLNAIEPLGTDTLR